MSIKQILIFSFLGILSLCSTYNLLTNSQCVQFDSTYNVCSKWVQSGTISQDTSGSCFIGQTIVKEKNKGFIMIKNVQFGDELVTMKNNQQIYSKVEGWLHKDQYKTVMFRKLVLQNNQSITVSDKHNIAFILSQQPQHQYTYMFPINSFPNKSITFPSNYKILSMTPSVHTGQYAPLTSQHSYLVYTSHSHIPILAHDFANIKNPQFWETIFTIVMGIYNFVYQIDQNNMLNLNGVHKAAEWMADWFHCLKQ